MNDFHAIAAAPRILGTGAVESIDASVGALFPIVAALPVAPVQHAASFILDSLVRRHADMFARLRELGDARFLIDVSDLPILFVLSPGADEPAIKIVRRQDALEPATATIGGTLSTLLSLLQGRVDGDALFFSRALTIRGDMAAVLCLRNTLDSAEIDLIGDIADRFGPAAGLARRAIQLHGRLGLRVARHIAAASRTFAGGTRSGSGRP